MNRKRSDFGHFSFLLPTFIGEKQAVFALSGVGWCIIGAVDSEGGRA